MFGSDDDGPSLGDMVDDARANLGRTQDDACDFCGAEEGSMTVDRTGHPDFEKDEIYRCHDCYNDPETWPESP